MRAHNFVDLTGQRFDRLLVLGFDHKDATRTLWWRCLCDCGKVALVRGYCLRGEVTRSCGCLKVAVAKERLTKHGHAANRKQSKEYSAWCDARHRIDNPNNNRYDRYSDKKMCAGLRNGFDGFLAVLGLCPDKSLSLHRIDNKGHYSCGACAECRANGWLMNCKWATEEEQQNNKSNNRFITFNGVTMTVANWARHLGIDRTYIYGRLYGGWTGEQVISYFSVDERRKSVTLIAS